MCEAGSRSGRWRREAGRAGKADEPGRADVNVGSSICPFPLAVVVVLVTLWPGHAEAQRRVRENRVSVVSAEPEVGVRGGYDFRYKAAVLGGQVKLPLGQALDVMA